MTTLAPNRTDLPPPFVPTTPSHTLYDGEHVVGWTRGQAIGFTGFATTSEAAAAAWVAHRAVARRMALDRGERPIPVDVEPLSLARSGTHDLVLAAGEPIARLVRPGEVHDGADPDATVGFELELDRPVSEVRIHGLSHLAYRALRRSGIRWALWDRARAARAQDAADRRASIARAEEPPVATPPPARPPAADDTDDTMHVIWRALVASAVAILLFIVTVGLLAAGLAANALLLLGGAATMAAAMIFVSRRRARRLAVRGPVTPALRGAA